MRSFSLLCCWVLALGQSNDKIEQQSLPFPRSRVPTGEAGPIFVVDTTALTNPGDQLTLQSLAGVLARKSPRVYTLNSHNPDPEAGDTTVFWMKKLESAGAVKFDNRFQQDFPGLLTYFINDLSGYVRFNPHTNSTNAAIIRCAASVGNVIAVGSNDTEKLLSSHNIPLVADVSSSSPMNEFQQGQRNLSRRMAISQPDDGSKVKYLSDYAVFGRIPIIEHSEGSMAFQAMMNNLDNQTVNALLGWTSYDEHQFAAHGTRAGAGVIASDFFHNSAFFANLPPAQPSQVKTTRVPHENSSQVCQTQSAVHTVAFVMSDGDNLQYAQNLFTQQRWYGSVERGALPVGWSYSPSVAELMPNALAWVRSTMTKNDSISSGPSGMGYTYPQLFSDAQGKAFAEVTGQLMNRSDMSLVNVIGVTPSAESLAHLVAQDQVQSIVYFTFSSASMGYSAMHGNVDYQNGKPVVGARINLWGDGTTGDEVGIDGLVKELKAMRKDPSDPQSYSVVVVTPSHNYSDVAHVGRLLADAGGFEVVLPEELIERLSACTGRARQCQMPTGPWSQVVGDLPKCSLPGDGTCLMTCENIHYGVSPLPKSGACDLAKCHTNLSFDGRSFRCADGSKCPTSHSVIV